MKKVLVLFSLISFSAQGLVVVPKNTKLLLRNYDKFHIKFSNSLCSKAEDHKHSKLLKDFRGEGFFVPSINDIVLDVEAIKEILPEFKQKMSWIKEEVEKLNKKKKIVNNELVTNRIKKILDDLLVIKEHYYKSESANQKAEYRQQSKKLVADLKVEFNTMLSKITFLKNYSFPVNHLEMRKMYDLYKDKDDIESQKNKNKIYLKRKMVEDGTYDNDRSYSDLYLRTTLNTLAYSLKTDMDILSEDLRYDLEMVIENINNVLKRGYASQVEKMNEWYNRTETALNFYMNLLNDKNKKLTDELLQKKSESRYQLKDYVLKKQSETYKFWRSKKEIYKAIFALETILMNEVGGVNYSDGLEKIDIIQVVLNRKKIDFYKTLTKEDDLYSYLAPLTKKEIDKEEWLNILFKEGEFSFTYYYMPETVRIFCPDMSSTRKRLRKRNLKLIVDVLRNPRWNFKATRYFSRVSMVGRIDMGHLWTDFRLVKERPGRLIKPNLKLVKKYKKGNYRYLYSFELEDGVRYDVINLTDDTYVVRNKSKNNYFYKYRNPHYFRYFEQY